MDLKINGQTYTLKPGVTVLGRTETHNLAAESRMAVVYGHACRREATLRAELRGNRG